MTEQVTGKKWRYQVYKLVPATCSGFKERQKELRYLGV
jgi:hypothetical protein